MSAKEWLLFGEDDGWGNAFTREVRAEMRLIDGDVDSLIARHVKEREEAEAESDLEDERLDNREGES